MAVYNVHGGHSLVCRGTSGLLDEVNEDRKVKNKLIEYLRAAGHTVYDCTDDTGKTQRQNLNNIKKKCNTHSVDLDISIHLNSARQDYAGDGVTGGVEVWNYNTATADVSDRICNKVAAALNVTNRGSKYTKNLFILSNTNSSALLVECCFVDDKDDYDHWNAEKCAKAIAEGILNRSLSIATAGWVKDSTGWWYRNEDGSYPKNQWLCLGNTWYYFDGHGYAVRNNWKSINGHWYYFDADCNMKTGWICENGDWYYLSESNTPYYAVGAMVTGWRKVDGFWYLLRSGWSGKHQTGSAVVGEYNDGTNDYYFVSSGEVAGFPGCSMLTGWRKKDGKYYWYNRDNNCLPIGAMMRNHWLKDNGATYYLKDDGSMACNETLQIGGKEYSFNSSGNVE